MAYSSNNGGKPQNIPQRKRYQQKTPRYSEKYGSNRPNPYTGYLPPGTHPGGIYQPNPIEQAPAAPPQITETPIQQPAAPVQPQEPPIVRSHRKEYSPNRKKNRPAPADTPSTTNNDELRRRMDEIRREAAFETASASAPKPEVTPVSAPQPEIRISPEGKPLIAIPFIDENGEAEMRWIPVVLPETETKQESSDTAVVVPIISADADIDEPSQENDDTQDNVTAVIPVIVPDIDLSDIKSDTPDIEAESQQVSDDEPDIIAPVIAGDTTSESELSFDDDVSEDTQSDEDVSDDPSDDAQTEVSEDTETETDPESDTDSQNDDLETEPENEEDKIEPEEESENDMLIYNDEDLFNNEEDSQDLPEEDVQEPDEVIDEPESEEDIEDETDASEESDEYEEVEEEPEYDDIPDEEDQYEDIDESALIYSDEDLDSDEYPADKSEDDEDYYDDDDDDESEEAEEEPSEESEYDDDEIKPVEETDEIEDVGEDIDDEDEDMIIAPSFVKRTLTTSSYTMHRTVSDDDDDMQVYDPSANNNDQDEFAEQDDALFIRRNHPEGSTAVFEIPKGIKLPSYIDDDEFLEQWLSEGDDMANISKKTKRKISTIAGAMTLALALVGLGFIILTLFTSLQTCSSKSSKNDEYVDFIMPIVYTDIGAFESWEAIGKDKLLECSLVAALDSTDTPYPTDDNNRSLVPSADVLAQTKLLFGESATLDFETLSASTTAETSGYFYDDLNDVFHVDQTGFGDVEAEIIGSPKVKSNTIEFVVGYKSASAIADDDSEQSYYKTMEYILNRTEDGYYVAKLRPYNTED